MYKLNLTSIREKCLRVDVEDKASLWHLRFGHLHHGGLKELTKKNMVHGLPNMCWISIIGQGNLFFSVRGNCRQEVVGRKLKCVK